MTARLYRQAFFRGGELALKNWPVLGTVFVYAVIMTLGQEIAFRLMGFLGGFAVGLLWAACASSFLSLVENIVTTSRVTMADFRSSFGAYLWDVIGVMFVLWLFSGFAVPILVHLPQGRLVVSFVSLLILVFFNAVPELIYLSHCTVLQLLQESYTFISENWMEWFPANVALIALLGLLMGIDASPLGAPGLYLKTAAFALATYFTMVVRGLLFLELRGTTHRSRAFKYRMQ